MSLRRRILNSTSPPERVIEEVDRFSVDTNGRNGLLSDVANLRVEMVVDPDTGGELRRGGETFSNARTGAYRQHRQ